MPCAAQVPSLAVLQRRRNSHTLFPGLVSVLSRQTLSNLELVGSMALFGWGVGDILDILDRVKELRDNFQNAPSEFHELRQR